jgi:hypothetical protein
MGWLLLTITAIGALFVGFLSLTSVQRDEPLLTEEVSTPNRRTPEEDLRRGKLDVEEYEAQYQPLNNPKNM